VFALPFFVLALAPQLVSQLPRAGGWLNSVKVVMGLLEIAAAVKFLSNVDLVWRWGVFTREAVLAVWIALGILTVLYVLGYFRVGYDAKVERIGALRLAAAIGFLAVTVAMVPGLFGKPLGELDSFLPPVSEELMTQGTASASGDGLHWILNDLDRARAQATREQKLVFVDFTGYTCTNCRWMEANMFPRAEVREELKKFITVRLYTDGQGALYDRQQKMQQRMFGTVALPLYAIVDAEGTKLATFPGLTRDPAAFLAFLRRN
jgi:thiol:disulfide interchange protein